MLKRRCNSSLRPYNGTLRHFSRSVTTHFPSLSQTVSGNSGGVSMNGSGSVSDSGLISGMSSGSGTGSGSETGGLSANFNRSMRSATVTVLASISFDLSGSASSTISSTTIFARSCMSAEFGTNVSWFTGIPSINIESASRSAEGACYNVDADSSSDSGKKRGILFHRSREPNSYSLRGAFKASNSSGMSSLLNPPPP